MFFMLEPAAQPPSHWHQHVAPGASALSCRRAAASGRVATRPWRVGEAWAFDDTIEHEAWNDSGEPRAILILDVWNPLLSEAERAVVRAVG